MAKSVGTNARTPGDEPQAEHIDDPQAAQNLAEGEEGQ